MWCVEGVIGCLCNDLVIVAESWAQNDNCPPSASLPTYDLCFFYLGLLSGLFFLMRMLLARFWRNKGLGASNLTSLALDVPALPLYTRASSTYNT